MNDSTPVTPLSGQPISRKRFIDWMLGTALGGLIVAVLYPVASYLVPPPAGESSVNSVTLDIKLADLKPNSGQIFKFGNEPGLLIRTPGGDVRAFTAVCTHLGCIVQYDSAHQEIWCPCHNGRYSLQGANISGPPPKPLAPYTVNVRGSEIVVSKEA